MVIVAESVYGKNGMVNKNGGGHIQNQVPIFTQLRRA